MNDTGAPHEQERAAAAEMVEAAPTLSWTAVERTAPVPSPADSATPGPTHDPVTAIATVDAQLRWVCDALIPASAELGMPSAVEAGVVDRLLPRALRARPDLTEPLLTALAALPADRPDQPIEAVRGLGDELFDLVSHMIAGAYFLDDTVNRLLKYPGQEALDYDPDFDEIEQVIDRVVERGPVYVEC